MNRNKNEKEFTSTSLYHAIWTKVKEAKPTTDNPEAKVRVVAPAEMHKRIDKAMRKRKWLEQASAGKNYGILHSSSEEYKGADAIIFWLELPLSSRL